MAEGKTIKEHIIYYMQNGDIYYDNFFCYDFPGRDVCKKALLDCFQDYVINNDCKLSKCMDETKRIYRNMYSNIRKSLIESKRNKANNFYLNWTKDAELQNILKECGLAINNNTLCISNTKAATKFFMAQVIPILEKHLHIKGIKVIKNASLYSHNLIDFSEAEIIED